MRASIRVLLVDDEPDFADLTATFLERTDERFTCVTTTSAEDALTLLADDEFDCVVSDYEMPVLNGLELLDAVRDISPRLPFILFTGKGSEAVASEAISAGVTDYLQKESGSEHYEILANRLLNYVERTRVRQERERLFQAIETAQEGICIFDSDGRFVYGNRACASLFGYEEERLIGRPWEHLFDVGDVARLRRTAIPRVTQGGSWRGETTGMHASGVELPLDTIFSSIDADGGFVCAVRDISERKAYERRLKQLHEAATDLFHADDAVEAAMITVEAADGILGYDRALVRLLDERDAVLVPKAVNERSDIDLEDRPRYPVGEGTAGSAFAAGEPMIYEDLDQLDDGYPRGEAQAAMYLPIEEFGTLTISVTEREHFDRYEVELAQILASSAAAAFHRIEQRDELRRHNEWLEAFVRTASHDLRTPLEVAEGRLSLLREVADSEHIAAIERAHARMRTLLDDLITLAKLDQGGLTVTTVDLSSMADERWTTVETADATLSVETTLRLEADPSRLGQLLENLFRNAVEHGGEDVTVRVGDLEGSAGFFVEDTGPGIAAEDPSVVFERGQTTKAGGTGFGLSIVKQIATAHGWEAIATNAEAGGARFEFRGVDIGSRADVTSR